MRKRLLSIIVSAFCGIALAACESSTGSVDSGSVSATSVSETSVETTIASSISNAANEADTDGETIKVGLMTASSGGTAVLDGYICNAAHMAADEINAEGGINGKQIEFIEEDYASDPSTASEKAEKLIVDDGVVCIVGVVMSSCRQAVLPVVEKYDNLLIYCTDYEGLEQSDNIIYIGCVPNQQIQTIAPWISENLGKKVYLIGNDYLYPRSTLAQMKAMLEENGAEIVGEEYLATDETDFTSSISKIVSAKPDVVFSVLVGDCITAFQKQYAQYGISDIDVFHLCLDESGVSSIGVENCEGVYSGQTYFCTVDSEENNAFREKYNANYDTEPTVYANNGYVATYLMAQAMKTLGDNFTSEDLIAAIRGQTFNGPAGEVTVCDNNHCTVIPRIGQVNADGLFDIVYQSDSPVDPDPFAGEAYYSESTSSSS